MERRSWGDRRQRIKTADVVRALVSSDWAKVAVEEAEKEDMENSRMICWEQVRSVESEGARREF